MAFFLIVDAVLLSVIVALAWVLIRRDRRRGTASGDGLHIEASAGMEVREARRRARAARHMNATSTTPYMRDR